MSQLSIKLFGPPRIMLDGKPIKINRRKAIALLAYLAVSQQSHGRDALAAMFWPDSNQSRARAALRSALWTLNKTPISHCLIVEEEGVTVHQAKRAVNRTADSPMALSIDVIHYRELMARVKKHDHLPTAACAACQEALREAVALYNNDFMAGFTLADAPEFDEWQFFQADSLRQELTAALVGLITFYGGRQEWNLAISCARRLVALDPLHEPAQRSLIELYAQAGQQSAALRQYEICRETLEEELGLAPSEATKSLYQLIYGGGWRKESGGRGLFIVDDTAVTEAPGPIVELPHNLPPAPTPFIGRQQEIARMDAFLADGSIRLLTITGPGGIGKTRLALAAAAEQLTKPNFPDGIYFVSLSQLSEPQAISPAIAAAVGYPFQSDQRAPQQQIFDYLSQKSMLLLLDNLEHLLAESQPDGATYVADLLRNAPGLKILATSREGLNLVEEQRFPLHGLAATGDGKKEPEYAAAALFLQAVRRRRPAFEISTADVLHLVDICQLVEGMPLALELAATWIETLSLADIAAEIRQNLDFLETTVRNVPDRHRSMQVVFGTSWNSLNEKEQKVYAALSLFRGGFTLEAAKVVTQASRKTLAGLVNKSLLRFNQRQKRYENHELLRQFAAEQLAGRTEAARRRHAAYFCGLLHKLEPDLKGAGQQQALAMIEADMENAHNAWQWAAERLMTKQLDGALTPLGLYYQWRGRFGEGAAVCQTAVSQLKQRSPKERTAVQNHLLVKLLTWQGALNQGQAQFDAGRQLLEEAQALLDELGRELPGLTATRAFLLLWRANNAIVQNFGGDAEALNEKSVALFRAIDDPWGTAVALEALSQKKMNMGLYHEAIQGQEEALAIFERLQDKRGTARAYNILGLVVLHIGQLERSEAYLRKSLSLFRTMDNRAMLSNPMAVLGINLLFSGKFEECIDTFNECWDLHRELGLAQEPFTASESLAMAKINLGRYEEARTQAAADLARYRAINYPWGIAFALFNLGRIELVEGATTEALTLCQESAAILQKMNEKSLLPDVLFCLAYGHLMLRERHQAVAYLIQGLEIAIETEPLNPMRYELPGMALLLVGDGETERAVEFYTAALQSPYIANSRWFEQLAGQPIAGKAAELPTDKVKAARARGQARDLWLTANELLAELREMEIKDKG